MDYLGGFVTGIIGTVTGTVSWIVNALTPAGLARPVVRPSTPEPILVDSPSKRVRVQDGRRPRTRPSPAGRKVPKSIKVSGNETAIGFSSKTIVSPTQQFPTQQLPSPGASSDENESHVIRPALPVFNSSTFWEPRPSTQVYRPPGAPEKAFYPKQKPKELKKNVLNETIRRRDTRSSAPGSLVPTPRKARVDSKHSSFLLTPVRSPRVTQTGRIDKQRKQITPRTQKKSQYADIDQRWNEAELEVLVRQFTKAGHLETFAELQQKAAARNREVKKIIEREEQEKKERELFKDRLPPITLEQHARWKKEWSTKIIPNKANRARVFMDKFRIQLHASDLILLADSAWLNDEVINFYMELICERANAGTPPKKPRILAQNTIFYKHISGESDGSHQYSYQRVSRWTKKKHSYGNDLGQMDCILVPVHQHGNHWCLAVINFAKKRFEYYDSLANVVPTKPAFAKIFENLRKWLMDETNKQFSLDGWTDFGASPAPRQTNGSDCGVFLCQSADLVARGVTPTQHTLPAVQMPDTRKIMLLELLDAKLQPRGTAVQA